MSAGGNERLRRLLLGLSIAVGLALFVIGIRFIVVPQSAARLFGLAGGAASFELHYVIGVRDLWLALVVIGLALFREWRGLALWLGFGAAVCVADGAIAASSSARAGPIAFHLASGVLCAVLAVACWREARRLSA
ncbi:MAG TPA: DUF4267 domain-containing protein [Hyphomicrobiaceae bacterium]|nr:DUF4267 domain-containing protein [Hyphomicrobiaceae bacterium]